MDEIIDRFSVSTANLTIIHRLAERGETRLCQEIHSRIDTVVIMSIAAESLEKWEMVSRGIFLGAFFISFFLFFFLLFESNVGAFQINKKKKKEKKKNSRKQTMHFDDALFEINPRGGGWYRRLGTGRFPVLKYTVAMLPTLNP